MRDFSLNYVCSNRIGQQPDAMLYTMTIQRTDGWEDHYLVPMQDRRDFLRWTAAQEQVAGVVVHFSPPAKVLPQ